MFIQHSTEGNSGDIVVHACLTGYRSERFDMHAMENTSVAQLEPRLFAGYNLMSCFILVVGS